MLRYAGRLEESAGYLERAAKYWDASPSNPYADNSELVQVLLLQGNDLRAAAIAELAVSRTRPWPKPAADAVYGAAWVDLYRGQFSDAIEKLRPLLAEHRRNLGSGLEKTLASPKSHLFPWPLQRIESANVQASAKRQLTRS
jgi:hypothetical protein